MCLTPYSKRLETPIPDVDVVSGEVRGMINFISLPCGKCPSCIRNRAAGWSFRLMKEIKMSETAYFVTWTYNTDSIPINEHGEVTLKSSDIQDSIKRLRYYHSKPEIRRESLRGAKIKDIKYYICGEYGEDGDRPHYHAIIINAFESDIVKAWDKGIVDIDEANLNTVDYVVGYIQKEGLEKENRDSKFSLMSKKIGLSYLTDDVIKTHRNNPELSYLVSERGNKVKMPRYYKDKIYVNQYKDNLRDYVYKETVKREDKERAEYEKVGKNYDKYKAMEKDMKFYEKNINKKLRNLK